MPKIKYITHDGTEYVVDVESGISAMEGAIQNMVPGIDADCGGAAACGTCHVYVDPDWFEKTGPAQSEQEREMLNLQDHAQSNSRLSCQIKISDTLDGLVLRLPVGQH